jgi:hypothetical protein
MHMFWGGGILIDVLVRAAGDCSSRLLRRGRLHRPYRPPRSRSRMSLRTIPSCRPMRRRRNLPAPEADMPSASRFELTKWYFDCVAPDGRAVIGYWASLAWRGMALTWQSVTLFEPGRPPIARSRLGSAPPPRVEGRRITWDTPALGCIAGFESRQDAIEQRLLGEREVVVQWRAEAPAAEAAFELHGAPPVRGSRLRRAPRPHRARLAPSDPRASLGPLARCRRKALPGLDRLARRSAADLGLRGRSESARRRRHGRMREGRGPHAPAQPATHAPGEKVCRDRHGDSIPESRDAEIDARAPGDQVVQRRDTA